MDWLISKLSKNKRIERQMNSFDFSSVENSRQIASELVFNIYRGATAFLVFLMITLSLTLYILSGLGQFFILGLLISIVIFTVYLFYIHSLAKEWFMKKFAAANGMSYQKHAPLSSVNGRSFEKGSPVKMHHVISGEYKDHSVRLFKYESATKRGRYKFKYRFTTFEIVFKEVTFPFILLQSKKSAGFLRLGRNEKEVFLESPFNEQFRLFVTKKYEIEALQIFTPDFLKLLQEKIFDFSIEFSEKRVYIYTRDYLNNKSELQELIDIGHKIFDSTGLLLNRLHSDFRSLHQYYRDK